MHVLNSLLVLAIFSPQVNVLYWNVSLSKKKELKKASKNSLDYRWTSEHLLNGVRINPRLWFFPKGTVYPARQKTKRTYFPENKPGDRMLDQLTYVPFSYIPNKKKKYMLVNIAYMEYWAKLYYTYDVFQKCPVNRCELSKRRDRFYQSDVILTDRSDVPPEKNRNPNQLWIYRANECPNYTNNRLMKYESINWTMTYRQDSDIVYPYARWIYHNPYVRRKRQSRNYAEGKTKMAAMLVSNCNKHYNKRVEYAEHLGKYIPVHIYGICGKINCSKEGDECLDDLEKHYKFYLAFENSNCRDYITEKLFKNALNRTILPVVMGARMEDYERVAPEGSYIHVEQFSGPKELAGYLKKLDADDDLYNSYFRWKGTGVLLFETYPWCRLCAMVHEKNKPRHYANFAHWWRAYACVFKPWNATLNSFDESKGSCSKIEMALYVLVAINLMFTFYFLFLSYTIRRLYDK